MSSPLPCMPPLPDRARARELYRQRPRRLRSLVALVVFVLLAFALLVVANPARADDAEALKTESPYFVLPDGEPGVDRLPLKATNVQARLLGPIADVSVTQHYRNEGTRPIDARYVFPGSTQAAVHAMTVRIGDRLLSADIREKRAARIEFDTAKREGKSAALLEQQRPNVFQMNVANIMPGDEVKVELRYTELIVPRDQQYEWVFPTVVGPRYNSPNGEARHEKWVAQPVLPQGAVPNHRFELTVALQTPLPVIEVTSPSHRVEVQQDEAQHADVTIAGGGAAAAGGVPNDRDFILQYRLAGEALASGVMLHQGRSPDDNFFLAMVEPPQAAPATALLPREYVFVVDISGSMHGFPLDTAKVLMGELLKSLKPSDRFNVLLFSGSSRMLAAESVPATQANVALAVAMLRETGGGGSTEIVPALRRIAELPKQADVSRTVVVVTDGYVAVEREVFELVRRNLGQSNVFAFGIGSLVNRHLIEGIARAGMGEAFVVTKPELAKQQAARFRRMIEAPLMTSVTARFEGLEVSDVEPRVLPDLLGNRPLVLYGKWRGDASNATMLVEGRTAQGAYRTLLPMAGQVSRDGEALRHLWARARIAALSDEEALLGGRAHKEAITALGLKYGLLTDYTSFIAVDRIVRNLGGESAQVDQPSPLPQGVSNLAVGAVEQGAAASLGAALPSTPEPAVWTAAAAMLVVLAIALRRRRPSGSRSAHDDAQRH
jgi:Ca-activated chloride channel family protein